MLLASFRMESLFEFLGVAPNNKLSHGRLYILAEEKKEQIEERPIENNDKAIELCEICFVVFKSAESHEDYNNSIRYEKLSSIFDAIVQEAECFEKKLEGKQCSKYINALVDLVRSNQAANEIFSDFCKSNGIQYREYDFDGHTALDKMIDSVHETISEVQNFKVQVKEALEKAGTLQTEINQNIQYKIYKEAHSIATKKMMMQNLKDLLAHPNKYSAVPDIHLLIDQAKNLVASDDAVLKIDSAAKEIKELSKKLESAENVIEQALTSIGILAQKANNAETLEQATILKNDAAKMKEQATKAFLSVEKIVASAHDDENVAISENMDEMTQLTELRVMAKEMPTMKDANAAASIAQLSALDNSSLVTKELVAVINDGRKRQEALIDRLKQDLVMANFCREVPDAFASKAKLNAYGITRADERQITAKGVRLSIIAGAISLTGYGLIIGIPLLIYADADMRASKRRYVEEYDNKKRHCEIIGLTIDAIETQLHDGDDD